MGRDCLRDYLRMCVRLRMHLHVDGNELKARSEINLFAKLRLMLPVHSLWQLNIK